MKDEVDKIDRQIKNLWIALKNPMYHRSSGKYNSAGYKVRSEIRELKVKKCDLLGHKRREREDGLCREGCGILV